MQAISASLSANNSFSAGMNLNSINSNIANPRGSRSGAMQFDEAQYNNIASSVTPNQNNNIDRFEQNQNTDTININANARNAYSNNSQSLDNDMRDFVDSRRLEENEQNASNVEDDIRQFVDDRRVNIDMNSDEENLGIDSALSSEAHMQRPVGDQIRTFAQNRSVDLNTRSEREEEARIERQEEDLARAEQRIASVSASAEEIQAFTESRTVEIEVNSDSEYAKEFASSVLYDRYFSSNRLDALAQEQLASNTINMTA